MGLVFFTDQARLSRFLWFLSSCGFALSLYAVPFLFKHSGWESKGVSTIAHFFPPEFYFHAVVEKYLLGSFAHPNYTGDLIALGFFPALGIFFYAWRRFRRGEQKALPALVVCPVVAGTIAVALALFLSRGSMLSFFTAFLIYAVSALVKFPSRTQGIITGAALLILLAMVGLSGQPQRIWKELQTIEGEFDTAKETSLSENREGAHRALGIFRSHPLGGIGTGRFWTVSKQFASEKFAERSAVSIAPETMVLANFKAMSHYLHVLAEEGLGAFFYFLFLLSCFFELGKGLGATKSRFQFFAALSLAASAFMVLFHAAFHFLMELFPIALMVYLLLGASLGVLHKDFVRS